MKTKEEHRQQLLIANVIVCAAACASSEEIAKLKHRRRYWVRPFLRRRKERGDFYVAVPDMLKEDPSYYFETFRMTPNRFETLLPLVAAKLREFSSPREHISPAERLQMTVGYLASGDQQKSIAKNFRIGRSTICNIIHETTLAIYEALQPLVLQIPNKEKWESIAIGFEQNWQFPHCVGAIDGKHFEIPAPPNSGSVYHNYKGYFSVVMMATCDSLYNFTTITVGSAGSENDAGIFQRSKLGQKLLSAQLNLPKPTAVINTSFVMPYVFLADEAFPLLSNLMRPYSADRLTLSRRVFNYRLSRARRVIENSFGILVARWRVLLNSVNMLPAYAMNAIRCCVVLHNFLRQDAISNTFYVPPGFVDTENTTTGETTPGEWRRVVNQASMPMGLERQGSNNYKIAAAQLRHQLEIFFTGVGTVPWQETFSWYH